MPAAIGLGISGASSLIGAKMGSNASKKAAEIQSASADKAMAELSRNRDDTRAALQQGYAQSGEAFRPYAQMGLSNLAQIYKGMGYGEMPPASLPPPMQFGGSANGGAYVPGSAVSRGGPMDSLPMPQPGARPNPGQPLSQMYGGMGANGAPGMVMMRAPTGQVKAVPPHQVQQFLARGASRVS